MEENINNQESNDNNNHDNNYTNITLEKCDDSCTEIKKENDNSKTLETSNCDKCSNDREELDFYELMKIANEEFDSSDNKGKSLEFYYKAFQKRASDVTINYRLGEVLEDIHQYDQAIIYFRNANKLSKLNSEPYHMYGEVVKNRLGNKCLSNSELDDLYLEAFQRYEIATTTTHILDYKVHLYLGITYIHFRKYDDAMKSIDKSIELNSKYYKSHYYKGNIFFLLGKLEDSLKSYKISLDIYPYYAYTYNNIGCVYHSLKLYSEALTYYEHAIELYPLFVNATTNIGIVFNELKEYDSAILCFDKSLKINDKDYVAMYNKAYSLQYLGRLKEAEEILIIAKNIS